MTTDRQLDAIHDALIQARAALERIAIDDMSPAVHQEVVTAKSSIATALYAVNDLRGKPEVFPERPE